MLFCLCRRPDAAGCSGGSWRLFAGLSRLLTRLVGAWGNLFARRGSSHPSPDGLVDYRPSSPAFSQHGFVWVRRVWIHVPLEVAACAYSWGLTLLANVVNLDKVRYTVMIMAICSFYYKTNTGRPSLVRQSVIRNNQLFGIFSLLAASIWWRCFLRKQIRAGLWKYRYPFPT